MGWLFIAVGAVDAFGAVGAMTATSNAAFWRAIGFVALFGFAAVVLAASVSMVRKPETDRQTALQPVFGH